MDNRPIGFFDSGLGGLTAIPFLQEKLPNEHIVYFGDTARTPYGSKAPSTIERFSFQIADFLASRDVKMMVIACNTISATCLDSLQARFPHIPIIGIIDPIANRVAREETEPVNIAVIATKVTIASRAYEKAITAVNDQVHLFGRACPAFVPLIEEGFDGDIMDQVIRYYLDDFIRENDIRKMVMGCTHYPLLMENFKRLYPQVGLLNPSEEVINEVQRVLAARDALAEPNDLENLCLASDLSENFERMVDRVFSNADEVHIRFKEFGG